MELFFTLLCAGAVTFMLRFLAALLKEGSGSPRRVSVYFARFNPPKRRGELIVMNSKNYVSKSAVEAGKRVAFIVVAAALIALPLHGQHTPNSVAASGAESPEPQANATPKTEDEIVQELAAMKKRIEQLEAALKQHEAAEQPSTVVHSATANPPIPASPSSRLATAAPAEVKESLSATAPPEKPAKEEPFAFADWTWLNGNARTKTPAFDSKFFTPEIRADIDYIYDLNHPKDDTIGGSSEVFRANEFHVTQLGVGGDFHYDNVRARLMTQFGLYSQTTPRNDASPARGQWNLADAYRYVSEASRRYHFNVQHGVNVDAGIFMSYVGLFSYYQFDNWAYQPSYVSSNTPWFFNGVRVQWFPTAKLKIEPWFINGWQSYGRFNGHPGLGGQLLWMPKEWFKLVANQYGYGQDNLGLPKTQRIHTDDSIEVRYYNNPENLGLSKMAFSLTGDAGGQYGGGLCATCAPIQGKSSFVGWMLYDRLWFHKYLLGLTL